MAHHGLTVNDVLIHIATETQAEQIAALEAECFSVPWDSNAVRHDIMDAQAIFWTATIEGNLVGYVGLRFAADTADITTFAVSAAYRRRRIATKLLDSVLLYCKDNGISNIYLEVRESNTPAQKLYERAGFERISVRKGYYQKPVENAVIYKREI